MEAGAFDGEEFSNTLYLEREYGWKGVLVEPSQENFVEIMSKNRKAWFLPSCLSPHQYPIEVRLEILLGFLLRLSSYIC